MDAAELDRLAEGYARGAREASRALRPIPAERRTAAILAIAEQLEVRASEVLAANAEDLREGEAAGLGPAMLDRLRLDAGRLAAMAGGLREIAAQADPVGRILSSRVREDGLSVEKVCVSLGVVLFIYESRPNVTTDAAGLCLRSGNAILLRGGKEAVRSNRALGSIIADAVAACGLPRESVQLVSETDRELVPVLLSRDREIDLVIPRGGEGLIRAVSAASRIPVLKHYKGVCHVYVHPTADPVQAEEIAYNAKVQRPGVCNAMETLLLDRALEPAVARRILSRLAEAGVELRGDEPVRGRFGDLVAVAATEADWDEEYLEKILSIKEVSGVDEALDHIARHGSGHTEAIVARDDAAAWTFVNGCDSASVMVNASTRFADGGEYGLGAEIGISTDKLHSRGPMGADDLCTYKWVVRGAGHVRK